MTTPELLKATGVIEPSLYVSLRRLVSIGYVVKENTTYRITPEGEEALRRRAEGERVLREEVMPELRKAIDLGFSTEYVVEKIKRKVLKAMGKVRWL
jgi:DNA-binding PadR family transcriptional regulator